MSAYFVAGAGGEELGFSRRVHMVVNRSGYSFREFGFLFFTLFVSKAKFGTTTPHRGRGRWPLPRLECGCSPRRVAGRSYLISWSTAPLGQHWIMFRCRRFERRRIVVVAGSHRGLNSCDPRGLRRRVSHDWDDCISCSSTKSTVDVYGLHRSQSYVIVERGCLTWRRTTTMKILAILVVLTEVKNQGQCGFCSSEH